MPIIRVEMFEGRTAEQKRRLAARLADAIVEEAGSERSSVRVVFTDVAKSDWAIGGEIVADRESGAGSAGGAHDAAQAQAVRREAAEAEAAAAAQAAEADVVGPEDRSSAT